MTHRTARAARTSTGAALTLDETSLGAKRLPRAPPPRGGRRAGARGAHPRLETHPRRGQARAADARRFARARPHTPADRVWLKFSSAAPAYGWTPPSVSRSFFQTIFARRGRIWSPAHTRRGRASLRSKLSGHAGWRFEEFSSLALTSAPAWIQAVQRPVPPAQGQHSGALPSRLLPRLLPTLRSTNRANPRTPRPRGSPRVPRGASAATSSPLRLQPQSRAASCRAPRFRREPHDAGQY